jgi:beta-glucanase (GH16 family)
LTISLGVAVSCGRERSYGDVNGEGGRADDAGASSPGGNAADAGDGNAEPHGGQGQERGDAGMGAQPRGGAGAAGEGSMGGATGGVPNPYVAGASGNDSAGAAGFSSGDGAGGEGGATPVEGCPPNVAGHCKPGAVYPDYPGYTLALVEDFEAPLDLNNDPIWTWSDGNPADGQTGFREEAIKFDGGYMTLSADKPPGCTASEKTCIAPRDSFAEAQAPSTKASIGEMGVWSGELRSKYNNYRYGRYEAKLQPPNQPNGNYLSMMYVFRTPKNVVWTEIDVMLEPWKTGDLVFGNAINFVGPGGQVGYPNDPARNDAWEASVGAGFDKFAEHVYAFNWTPEKVEWFVDGKSVHTFTGEPQNLISTKSAKIMMNLWVFGGSAAFGDPTKNTYPMAAKFDWFRFYRLADVTQEPTYPCSPAPACLPAADKTKSSQNNPKETNYGQ